MSAAQAAEVFGPERPDAAVRAIEELRAAKAAQDASPWSEAAFKRVQRAAAVRAMYPEYGDTFRGHGSRLGTSVAA